jgi:hypothetical protein
VPTFRDAVEARDIDAAIALLADDVVFHSPIAFTPYRGRDTVGTILRAVIEVFEDFRYVREIGAEPDQALVFRAAVAGRELEGCDFLRLTPDGRIHELTVMVRPLNAAVALAEAMKARLTATSG